MDHQKRSQPDSARLIKFDRLLARKGSGQEIALSLPRTSNELSQIPEIFSSSHRSARAPMRLADAQRHFRVSKIANRAFTARVRSDFGRRHQQALGQSHANADRASVLHSRPCRYANGSIMLRRSCGRPMEEREGFRVSRNLS